MDDIEYQLTPKGEKLADNLAQMNVEKEKLFGEIVDEIVNSNGEPTPTAAKLKDEMKELNKKIAEAKTKEIENKKQVKKVHRKKQTPEIEPGSRHGEYDKAKKIREQSMSSLIADQEGGLGTSVRKAISSKFNAKMTGIKESFDPLNIAKFLTFGSDLGPALMGKLTGRTKGDMGHYMSNKPSIKNAASKTATEIEPTEQSVGGMNDILIKILTLLQQTNDESVKQREKENSFAEENERERQKRISDRHKELLDALKGKFGTVGKEGVERDQAIPKMPDTPDIDTLLGDVAADSLAKTAIKTGAKALANAGAKEAGKTASKVISKEAMKEVTKKVLSKSAFKTAVKSVPIGGLLFGLGFGLKRAIAGDWTGAAIETAGGVAGPFTSISLGLVQAGRDVHNALYGHYPDPTNPEDMENMKEIGTVVKDVATELYKSETSDNKGVSEISYDLNGMPTGYEEISTGSASSDAASSPKNKTPSNTPASGASAAPTTPKNKTPSAAPTSSGSAAPTSSPNPGEKLNNVVAENNTAKLPSNSKSSSPVVNKQTNVATSKNSASVSPIAAVRNSEDTFQRMIMNSTRVV